MDFLHVKLLFYSAKFYYIGSKKLFIQVSYCAEIDFVNLGFSKDELYLFSSTKLN